MNISGLHQLIKQATEYSRHMMSEAGRVPPTIIAATPFGTLTYFPNKFETDEDKQLFYRVARLIAIAHEAEAVAVIIESFLTPQTGCDVEGTSAQPPDGREAVLIMAESRGPSGQSVLSIRRNPAGKFVDFDADEMIYPGRIQGFPLLLSPKRDTKHDILTARMVLDAMKIVIFNKGPDPRWN